MSKSTESTEKWTEIEHLPEWDEEFYDVYTAKKFGKWVMLKTLKPELKELEEYRQMLEREFEVRYNLAHSHIIMINDLETVPGLGLCIITDDVYGDSLAKLIEKKEVTPEIVNKITHNLVDAIDYLQTNHIVHYHIRPETVIFTENIRNLKVIDVGFDQKHALAPTDVTDDIRAFGAVLKAALDACPDCDPKLYTIADVCLSPAPYSSVQQLQMAINGGSQRRLYITIIAILAVMVAILSLIIIFRP
ncbi:MAG: protein kinase [Bacteroides sp.]|nr:protein kinase [Bacteroides sp.]MCM1379900.1 protein kinase [Bacteroides sp.]MCM1446246.1 protein kinase [Prevotella sp.]